MGNSLQTVPKGNPPMLPTLTEVPQNQAEWDRFAFHNKVSHDAIDQAIQLRGGGRISESILYPVDAADWGGWLQRHSLLHQQMNTAVGAQSADLSLLDSTNEGQVAQWINTHWLEHQTVEAALGIAS